MSGGIICLYYAGDSFSLFHKGDRTNNLVSKGGVVQPRIIPEVCLFSISNKEANNFWEDVFGFSYAFVSERLFFIDSVAIFIFMFEQGYPSLIIISFNLPFQFSHKSSVHGAGLFYA